MDQRPQSCRIGTPGRSCDPSVAGRAPDDVFLEKGNLSDPASLDAAPGELWITPFLALSTNPQAFARRAHAAVPTTAAARNTPGEAWPMHRGPPNRLAAASFLRHRRTRNPAGRTAPACPTARSESGLDLMAAMAAGLRAFAMTRGTRVGSATTPSRSGPAREAPSMRARETRSIPACGTRSIPARETHFIPARGTHSIPARGTHSIPARGTRR